MFVAKYLMCLFAAKTYVNAVQEIVEITDEICTLIKDKEFSVVWSRRGAKFCSKKCLYDKNAHWLKCKYCEQIFRRTDWEYRTYKSSYCSTKCYELDRLTVFCDGCQKTIHIYPSQQKYYDKHYCSDRCRIKFGPIGRLTDNDIMDNNYQRFVRKVRHCARYYEWRNQVQSRDNFKCTICGSGDKLTAHHKYVSMYDFVRKHGFDVKSIYADNMFFDIKNGQLLCRSCHAKKHRE